jgi:hypothetical protein
MVYLIVILVLYTKLEFMNIIRISTNDIYIFQVLTSCPNIIYSIVEYKEDKFRRRDIIVVYRLIE